MATKEQAARYRYNKKISKLLELQDKAKGYASCTSITNRQLADLYKALQQVVVAFMPFVHRLGTAAQNNITDLLEDCEGIGSLNVASSWYATLEQLKQAQEIKECFEHWNNGHNLTDQDLAMLVNAVRLAESVCEPFQEIIGVNNVAWLRVTLSDLMSLQTRRQQRRQ